MQLLNMKFYLTKNSKKKESLVSLLLKYEVENVLTC